MKDHSNPIISSEYSESDEPCEDLVQNILYKCEYCETTYVLQSSRSKHMKTCVKKFANKLIKEKDDVIKNIIKEKDDVIKEKDNEINNIIKEKEMLLKEIAIDNLKKEIQLLNKKLETKDKQLETKDKQLKNKDKQHNPKNVKLTK